MERSTSWLLPVSAQLRHRLFYNPCMTIKERLHRLVDELSEQEAQRARIIVEDERADAQRRREIDKAIIDSYTRTPQEDLGAGWAARESIREEPWDREASS